MISKPQFLFLYGLAMLVLAMAGLIQWLVPVCLMSESQEDVLFVALLIPCALIYVVYSVFVGFGNSATKKAYMPYLLVMLMTLPGLNYVMIQRSVVVEQMHWVIDGLVDHKQALDYGHQSNRIVVVSGEQFRFFPEALWQRIQPGDHLLKQACNNVLSINQQDYPFTP